MEITVNEIEPCYLSIRYVADAGEILEVRGQVLQQFKKAPVSGFRPGKASMEAIKHTYRNQIEESLKRALAEKSFHDVIFEKKLKIHGQPKFNTIMMLDSSFVCEFETFIKPDINLAPYKELEIPKPHQVESVIEIAEKMMQDLRVKYGEAAPYSDGDTVAMGDNIIIDYSCYLDGEKLHNLSAEGEMMEVGKSQLANFDQNLIGMKVGEVREFDLLVPENGMPSLIGKTVNFLVSLTMGSRTDPAPLDDTLAKRMGKKDLAEVRDLVSKAAMGKNLSLAKQLLNAAISNRLVADNEFVVPSFLTLSEAKYLAQQSKLEWEPLPDVDKERFIDIARRNVKLALILDRIREVEAEAGLTDQEVFEIIKTHVSRTVASPEEATAKMEEMNRSGYFQLLFSRIKDEHTLDFIGKSAKIID
jgi:trigger factor